MEQPSAMERLDFEKHQAGASIGSRSQSLNTLFLKTCLALLDRNWNIYWEWSDWILKALNLSILWLTITILKCSFLKISLALLDRN
jgi:hypothetical protein